MRRSAAMTLTVLATIAVAAPAGAQAAKAHVPVGPVTAGVIVSPQPGTPDAMPQTQISILGPALRSIGKVTVVGSKSASHSGHLRPYSNGRGASFVLSTPLTAGEEVGVSFDVRGAGAPKHIAYHFTVATPATPSMPYNVPTAPNLTLNAQSFVTRPDLHPTDFAVAVHNAGLAPGDEFVAPIRGPGPPGPMFGQYGTEIMDGRGAPVWFRPAAAATEDFDFTQQIYNGAPVLTFWEGRLSAVGVGVGANEIYDSSYRKLGQVSAGNGLAADIHDFVVTPQNTALLLAYEPIAKDLSPYGGASNATFFDNVVQEIDIKTHLVMWEWHFSGNVDPAEAQSPPQAGQTWDAFHLNSIQQLANGNLVLSARNTWTIYEVNKATGRLVWRVGGKRSTFAVGPGARFTWQHDARLSADGKSLSLFDDEAAPPTGPQSRGLVLKLDSTARTATVAREYDHKPAGLLAGSQGNMQLLPNGDELVGWGAQPYLSEFDPGGNLVFDGHFVAPIESYRSFRFPWAGHPTDRPVMVAKAAPGGMTTVYASWNGATDVASWQFLAGSNARALAVVGTAARNGFESSTTVAGNGPYFAVRALSASGRVLAQSHSVTQS